MTNEEKNNLTYGFTPNNGCAGISGSAPRVGFPGLCLQDAGNGVRGVDLVNSYASGVHVGATWNKALAYQRAQFMGAEFKAKGVNVALGPVVGPLGRTALAGRNWEGFSNDPYLCGSLAYETVVGLQESVIASVKHFIAYEQETDRNPVGNITSVSSNLDDRTMHEAYLWPFQDAVRAGAACIMPSYNKINNSWASQNSKAQNGLLKTELGFQGFTVSDWGGQHTGIASAESGLDMAMPDSVYWENGTLATAVANGTLAQSRLDDMVTRIIAAWYQINEDSSTFPALGVGMGYNLTQPHARVDARDPASKPLRVQQAVEGHVLVKNVNNTLPLKKPKFLSLFGYDGPVFAEEHPYGGMLSAYTAFTLGGEGLTIPSDDLLNLLFVTGGVPPQAARNGTLIVGGGSGANTPAYISAPYDAFSERAYEDGTFLFWDFVNQAPLVDPITDACIVFINEFSTEGDDRAGLADPWSDVLVTNVANSCSNTIVSIHNAGIRLVNNWINHPNVTAVIYSHLPGQDSGRSLVQVMYGDQSPSGRLPYTVAKNASDYGNTLAPSLPSPDINNNTHFYPQSDFTEGVLIDYKHFIANNIAPQFEFGFGLTYTTFNYSDLSMALTPGAILTRSPPAATTVEGGNPHLYDIVATVTCVVQNSGGVDAADVAQLYLGIPGAPAKQLRGFEKQMIQSGAAKNVRFDLTRRDMSIWDVAAQQWALQSGSYMVYVGESVLDVRLTGNLTVSGNSLGV